MPAIYLEASSVQAIPERDRKAAEPRTAHAIDEALPAQLEAAKADAELSALTLGGWYALWTEAILDQSELAFHERHFPSLSDVALILTPQAVAAVLLRIYARSVEGVLTQDEHRGGERRLPAGARLAASAGVEARRPIG